MRRTLIAGAVTLALVLAGCAVPGAEGNETAFTAARTDHGPPGDRPLARTDLGILRGVTDHGVHRFRKVPYAQPPVGSSRWAMPRPATRWQGIRDASVSGPPCPQAAGAFAEAQTDEDCLYLEVTAPATRKPAGRPVLVWLTDSVGTGSGTQADPARLATQGDAVVVMVNARLGVFGSLALPGMTNAGQFALADQQEALRFVRRNAHAFGGDPRNVTLGGESGGGVWTCVQLTSPAARGLFDRAIVMSATGNCADPLAPDFSGPGLLPQAVDAFPPVQAKIEESQALAARLGCTDPGTALACARKLPVTTLLSEPPGGATANFAPGSLLPRSPLEAIAAGRFHHVPVLSGTTRDEAQLLLDVAVKAGLPPLTEQTYQAVVRATYPAIADQVLARYPTSRYESPNAAWIAVSSDRAWSCPAAILNDELADHSRVYGYEFSDRTAPYLYGQVHPSVPTYAAGHGSDVSYLFDEAPPGHGVPAPPPNQAPVDPLTPAQLRLATTMIRTWTDFARTGRADLPRWHRGRPLVTAFGDPQPPRTRAVDFGRRHRCDLWAADIRADLPAR